MQIHLGGEARKITGHFLISTMAIFKIFGGGSFPSPPVDRTLAVLL